MNSFINGYVPATIADATPHILAPSVEAGINALYDERRWLESFQFRKKFTMRKCNTYLSFIKYFDQAKIEYFKELGLDGELNNCYCKLVITEMNCQFCNEAEYKEMIEVLIKTTDIGKYYINLEYVIIESYTNEILFLGSAELMLIDKKKSNYMTIPPNIRQGLYEF